MTDRRVNLADPLSRAISQDVERAMDRRHDPFKALPETGIPASETYSTMEDRARRFCALSGLNFVAVSGDGWLDTREQSDISPRMWLPVLRRLTAIQPGAAGSPQDVYRVTIACGSPRSGRVVELCFPEGYPIMMGTLLAQLMERPLGPVVRGQRITIEVEYVGTEDRGARHA